jgi:hypothetical protein
MESIMNQTLRPPHLTEVILCGVERAGGPPLYYARGAISGDWYITCPVLDQAALAGLARALAAGERQVTHPCGAPMVRLKWLATDMSTPRLLLEDILETHGLQAPN